MRKPKEYAYYRGDEFIMIGTIQEIAEAYDYKLRYILDTAKVFIFCRKNEEKYER